MLGKGVVGKSSLVYRFINKENPEEHDATIEDRYTSVESIDGINTTIEILDTAGEEDYQNLLDMWINYAEGFLLVFAINDKESFNALKGKYDRIMKVKGTNCPIILVGNKCDLEDKRKVTKEEGESYAKSKGVDFMEVSALKTINVKETFVKLAHNLLEKKVTQKTEAGGDKCCIIF